MPGQVIGQDLAHGFAGSYARTPDSVIETIPVVAGGADVEFGQAVITETGGTIQKADAGALAANFVGVAVREIKSMLSYLDQSGAGVYKAQEPASIITRGNVMVKCNVGTPAMYGAVYLRITANGAIPTGVVGGFEAAADGGNTVQLTNCVWRTAKDANGIAELAIKSRNAS